VPGTNDNLLPYMPKLQNHVLTSSYPCPPLEDEEQFVAYYKMDYSQFNCIIISHLINTPHTALDHH